MRIPISLIAATLVVGSGLSAKADWHGHGWGGGYHHHDGYYGHSSFFFSAPVYPVVVSRPVYYSRPVYEGREVYRRDSLEVNVQIALRKRGYYSGPVDGDIGPGTRAAIRAYQRDHGLRPTGEIGTPLLDRLGL